MKKYLTVMLILSLLLLIVPAHAASPWQPVSGPIEPIEIFVPQVVSAWTEYEIKININDPEIRENATKIKIGGFNGIILEKSGLKPLQEEGEYLYSGEKTLLLKVLAKQIIDEEYIKKNEKLKYTTFKIHFWQELNLTKQEYENHPINKAAHGVKEEDNGTVTVSRQLGNGQVTYEVAAPTISVTKPMEYAMTDYYKIYLRNFDMYDNTTKFNVGNIREGSDEYQISMSGSIGVNSDLFTKDELLKAADLSTKILLDDTAPMLEVPEALLKYNGMDYGFYRTKIIANDLLGKTVGFESYILYIVEQNFFFYRDGRQISFRFSKSYSADANRGDAVAKEVLKTFENMIYNLQVVEQYQGEYAIPKTEKQGPVKYTLSLVSNGRTVFNNGVYNTGTVVDSAFTPVIKIEKSGNFDESEKLYLYGEILNANSETAIGFVEANNSLSKSITYLANDVVSVLMRTYGKMKGNKFNPEEKVEFKLKDSTGTVVSNKVVYTVKIADAAPRVVFSNPNPNQMQSQSESAFSFKIEDPDSQNIKVTISTPFGKVKGQNGDWVKKLELSSKPGQDISIAFQSPEVGNFLLNKEIEGLSMLALQEGTILQAIADLEALGMDRFIKGLESKADMMKRIETYGMDLDNYEEKMKVFNNILSNQKLIDNWSNLNDLMNNINNVGFVSQVQQQGATLGQELNEALTFNNKTVSEIGSDIGIAGISLLQTGVGGFAAAAGYLTGSDGKALGIGADKMAAFNLMTNVWKGNFKYWSKAEKIDRAEERIEMIPIIVTAVDEGGLIHRAVLLIPVVGLEV